MNTQNGINTEVLRKFVRRLREKMARQRLLQRCRKVVGRLTGRLGNDTRRNPAPNVAVNNRSRRHSHNSFSASFEVSFEPIKPNTSNTASPSVANYLHNADRAHGHLRGTEGQRRHIIQNRNDDFGASLVSLDPSLLQVESYSVDYGTTTIETLSGASSNRSSHTTESMEHQHRRIIAPSYIGRPDPFDKTHLVQAIPSFNLAAFRGRSFGSGTNSDDSSVYVLEESLIYPQFPDSFICGLEDQSVIVPVAPVASR